MNQTVLQTNVTQKKGFWRQQFQERATKKQRRFDWIFGVIMPAICFLLDPIFFKSSFLGGKAIFGAYKPFAYVLSYVSIMTLFAFLTLGKKAKYFNAFFAGIFLIGGIVSLFVGIVLFPFSFIGLLVFIGILGFTPLLTAVVFLRNFYRAFQTAKPFLDAKKLWTTFALTAIFSFAIPLALNIQIERIFSAVKNGNPATVRANSRTLRMLSPIINPDRLVTEYKFSDSAASGEKQMAIAELYYGITGENITKKSGLID